MCERPALLCGLEKSKGKILEGYDADFCVWDPDEEFQVDTNILNSSNKVNIYILKACINVFKNQTHKKNQML